MRTQDLATVQFPLLQINARRNSHIKYPVSYINPRGDQRVGPPVSVKVESDGT